MTWTVVPGSGPATGRVQHPPRESKRELLRAQAVRVLIVDDEPSICKALGLALSNAGYEVFIAKSGETACSVVETESVDVMLVDLRIPDMRGDMIFEYAAGVQPNLRHSTLFMTGDISDQAVGLIAACKCHFIRKPFDLSVMTDAVAALSPIVEAQKSSA